VLLGTPSRHCGAGTRGRVSSAAKGIGLFLLALLLLIALGLRLYRLAPVDVGLLYAQDADEGVYATTAQLALQGYVPYRDFFTPMPPGAIYLFMAVLRVFYHPWGSAVGLMALRYTCVALGVLTVLLTYRTTAMIGGCWAGLLAAALLAVDGIVVAQDRRAMLEAPTNLLSLLAILSYLLALKSAPPQRWRDPATDKSSPFSAPEASEPNLPILSSGFFCALALLTKGTALVPVLVVGLHLLVRRRWRQILWFAGAFVAGYLLCASLFLLVCPVDFLKQNYFFHFLRPWDGTVNPQARLAEMWGYTWSWTTIRFALVGAFLMLLTGKKARHLDLFLVVLTWAALMLFLLLGSRTYWATYFSQLAVPCCILGGLMLNNAPDQRAHSLLDRLPQGFSFAELQILLLASMLALGYPQLRLQYNTTRAALEQAKPVYPQMTEYINQRVPSGASILAFETNYTFLSSHPPAGAQEGSFFIDSYGEMLYRNLQIPERSIIELLAAWAQQERVGTRAVFYRQPAQATVLLVFERAPYMVLDGRALKQLTEETGSYLQTHSQVLESAYASELRIRIQ
jgi:4-amino-4-deoxy-L-arabinose transferase-like glycosyltransferase